MTEGLFKKCGKRSAAALVVLLVLYSMDMTFKPTHYKQPIWISIRYLLYCIHLSLQIPLSDIWLSTCVSDVSEVTLDGSVSFVIGWPITNVVITFR